MGLRRVAAALAGLAVAALIWTGCGGSDGGGQTAVNDTPGASRLEGFALAGGAGRATVGVSGADGTPLTNVVVTLRDVTGAVIAITTTDGQGFFTLADDDGRIVATLEIADPSGLTTLPVTLIPGATLQVGAIPSVTRQQAIDAVLATVGPDALVAMTQNPLPAGTRVYPMFGDSEGGGPFEADVHTVASGGEWFALVDRQTYAPFSHEVEYAYVNATTGAVVRETRFWLPVVNGRLLWAYHGNLILLQPETAQAAAVAVNGSYPAETQVATSPDVVQIPDVLAPEPEADARLAGAQAAAQELIRQAGTAEDVYAMVFCGTPEPEFLLGARRMLDWLRAQGVPSSNVRSTLFMGFNRPTDDELTNNLLYAADGTADLGSQVLVHNLAKLEELETMILAKRRAGKTPTLYLYATSHSAPNGLMVVVDNYTSLFLRALTFGSPWARVRLDEVLPVQTTAACNVRIVLDTCFAGGHLRRYLVQFQRTRHDFAMWTASGTFLSTGDSFWREVRNALAIGETSDFSKPGLLFTKQWVASAALASNGTIDPGPILTGVRGFRDPFNDTDTRRRNDRKFIALPDRGQCPPMDPTGGGGGDTGGGNTGGDTGGGNNTVPGVTVTVD